MRLEELKPAKQALKECARQIAMVIDLNKCIGCQACTVACKTLWTDEPGQEHMYWQNVETKPGPGYPRNWEQGGGGFKDGKLVLGTIPSKEDHGIPWTYDYKGAEFEGTQTYVKPNIPPTWGPNWDEDVGAGAYPNNYYFYFPKLCVHCTNPPCVDACPVDAIYKRDEDGIVLISDETCQGNKKCISACPYKEIYFNEVRNVAQKCIFCFPKVEKGVAPACCKQCVGRVHHVGYMDDEEGSVYKLVKQWKVALPLHPEYGTEPNIFYIPPMSPPRYNPDGSLSDESRIPLDYLESLFGDGVQQALDTLQAETEKKKQGQPSEVMDTLIGFVFNDMFQIPSQLQQQET